MFMFFIPFMFIFFMFMFCWALAFAGLAFAVGVGGGDAVTALFALALVLFTFSAVLQASPSSAGIKNIATAIVLRIELTPVWSFRIRELSSNSSHDFYLRL